MSLQDTETVLSRQLELRLPFSMVRVGDGEGAVLGRPRPEDSDLWQWVGRQLAPDMTPELLNQLSDRLEAALDSADIVGVRNDIVDVYFPISRFSLPKDQFRDRFIAEFRIRPVDRNIDFSGALRIAHTNRWLGEYRFPQSTRFCSAWVHFHLSSSGALLRYLRQEERPALITGKEVLATELRCRLGKEIDYYRAPNDYPTRNLNGYLDVFEQIAGSIEVKYPGQLFLVGGGIWSKWICHRIKALGGIALDIGAVCDAWLGIASRPAVFESMFNSAADVVPKSLLLSIQTEGVGNQG